MEVLNLCCGHMPVVLFFYKNRTIFTLLVKEVVEALTIKICNSSINSFYPIKTDIKK